MSGLVSSEIVCLMSDFFISEIEFLVLGLFLFLDLFSNEWVGLT